MTKSKAEKEEPKQSHAERKQAGDKHRAKQAAARKGKKDSDES